MIDHPRLTYTEDDEPAIAITLDPTGEHNFEQPARKTFVLSTRASGLLVDDLSYSEREEISYPATNVLFLTEGAYLPDEKLDRVDLIQRLRFPDGGKHPTKNEIERVAAYLKTSEIEEGITWLAGEIIEESRLSDVMSVGEIKTQRERINGLRGIAKDL